MMLEHLSWQEAAATIVSAINRTTSQMKVTYDFERLMEGVTLVTCSGFADALIGNM